MVSRVQHERSLSGNNFLIAFESYLARKGRALHTSCAYLAVAADFNRWAGERTPGSFSANEVENGYLASWEEDFRAAWGRAPSRATVRNRIVGLRAYFSFLERREWLRDAEGQPRPNPMHQIEQPKREQKPIEWLSDAEDVAIFDACETATERIIVNFLRWTGMRVDEARSITLADVDLTYGRETIRVRRSKTRAGLRTIPVLPELLPELWAWLAELERRGLASPNVPLLASQQGKALNPQYIWRIVKRVAARGGVRVQSGRCDENKSAVTPHMLRRTFGSHLLNSGVRLETVSKLMGHANTAVTSTHYAELLDATVRRELLEALSSHRLSPASTVIMSVEAKRLS
jgi:integrase